MGRRRFVLRSGILVSAATAWPLRALAGPALVTPEAARPQLAQGIQIGDVSSERALIWARADRPARLFAEWDLDALFPNPRRVRGPYALEDSDYTARLDLTGLPPEREIFLRVWCEGLANDVPSAAISGRFRTAPVGRRDVRFLWSGDTVGQGYGINPDVGGMRIYETMRQRRPDFFIHSGDTIYADGPLRPEITVEDGKLWRNLVTEEKSKVAETLAEFRSHQRYNFLDDNLRGFNAEVPQIWQWDDHEVVDNYSPGKQLAADTRYTEKSVKLLAARGQRAFQEYAPLRRLGDDAPERIYRQLPYGPLLDVFVLDMQSYRASNGLNLEPQLGGASAFLGRPQLRWLKRGLSASRATWKVIAADMPIGLVVRDGKDDQGRDRFEGISNGAGPALGRELEVADLLRFMQRQAIRNVVWLTADVHYTAAHYYDPSKATFSEFDPFWEFVSGPLNAGSFGPNDPDPTFGMQVVYQKVAPVMNASPLAGHQFFGEVEVRAADATLAVTLRDSAGTALYVRTLQPYG